MFGQWLNSHRIFKQLAKALISLRICAGWSEPLLVAHTTLLEISCRGSHVQYLIMLFSLYESIEDPYTLEPMLGKVSPGTR